MMAQKLNYPTAVCQRINTRLGVQLVGSVVLLACIPSIAYSKLYIGYGLAQVQIGGDMDGSTFVAGGGSAEVLPEQTTKIGNKFIIGSQSDGSAIEFSITQSEHDGAWQGIPLISEFFSLNFDGKLFFRKGMLRPFGLLGFGFTSVTVKDGSTDGFRTEDAKFKGTDIRFGAGIEFAVQKNIAIDLQVVRRWGSYNSVAGIESGSIDDDINGDGMSTSLEVKYIFR